MTIIQLTAFALAACAATTIGVGIVLIKRHSDWMDVVGGLCAIVCALLVLFGVFTTPARAEVIDAKLASVRCSVAGAARLRNPQTARYIWRDEIVTPGKDQNSWVVVLPVRAANGLGMMTNGRFVCILKNGRVVEIAGP